MTDSLTASVVSPVSTPAQAEDVLAQIEQRLLWLATSIVYQTNRVRPNPSGLKVGGHQASSASMVSIMTALWFGRLRAQDRVAVKPHASPFGGLQCYPSRTKAPGSRVR